jgi:hypothetical protein
MLSPGCSVLVVRDDGDRPLSQQACTSKSMSTMAEFNRVELEKDDVLGPGPGFNSFGSFPWHAPRRGRTYGENDVHLKKPTAAGR